MSEIELSNHMTTSAVHHLSLITSKLVSLEERLCLSPPASPLPHSPSFPITSSAKSTHSARDMREVIERIEVLDVRITNRTELTDPHKPSKDSAVVVVVVESSPASPKVVSHAISSDSKPRSASVSERMSEQWESGEGREDRERSEGCQRM